ncbi:MULTISPECIES: SH3 domain-containing protein [unclassified Phyllobacterium]|uniref:SH3 domain-containing protein n=1 Tax=unclassified Phyllobacterium TaxID=2638441 RepID=UPI00301305D5
MMDYKRLYLAFALGFVFLVSAEAAHAANAFTTANVNLRTGPGTSYGRVATLAPGVRVEVLTCQSNWCRVGRQGIRGWVSASYLEHARAERPVIVRPIIVRPRYHRVRPPYHGHRPPHRPHRPRPNCKIAPGFSCR